MPLHLSRQRRALGLTRFAARWASAMLLFTSGDKSTVAIAATDPDQVKSLHAKALALGAQDEGAPGARGGKFYGAYFRDLDGNKLAVFCMTA